MVCIIIPALNIVDKNQMICAAVDDNKKHLFNIWDIMLKSIAKLNKQIHA